MLRHTRTALTAVLLMVAAATAACTDTVDDDPSRSTSTGRAITSALLSSSDLPGLDRDTDGEPEGLSISCFSETLDANDPLDSAEVTYAKDGGFPAISNVVEVYRDELEVERVMADIRRGIQDCEQVSEPSSGLTANLHVAEISLPVPTGVDDQVAFTAQGSAGAVGVSVDVGLSVAVASVGRFITMVAVVDGGDEDSSDLLATFGQRAEDRLLNAGAGSL